MSARTSRSLAAALGLFVASTLTSCADGFREAEVSAMIGPAGGTLEVTEGELAGAALIIPPGAVSTETRFQLSLAFSSITPGFEQLERAVGFQPNGFRFERPVTLRLPFVSQGQTVRFVGRDARQPQIELGPTEQIASDLAEVQALELLAVWPAIRQFRSPGSPDVEVDEFLPLQSGNVWAFDSGVFAQLTARTDVPNLNGVPVFALNFTFGAETLILYLQRSMDVTALLGAVASDGASSVQSIFGAANFLPDSVTYQIERVNVFRFDEFEPLGATTATAEGNGEFQSLFDNGADVDTPVGMFDDTMSITFVLTLTTDSGEPRAVPFRMTLARDVGLVELEIFGRSGTLQSGTVNGMALGI